MRRCSIGFLNWLLRVWYRCTIGDNLSWLWCCCWYRHYVWLNELIWREFRVCWWLWRSFFLSEWLNWYRRNCCSATFFEFFKAWQLVRWWFVVVSLRLWVVLILVLRLIFLNLRLPISHCVCGALFDLLNLLFCLLELFLLFLSQLDNLCKFKLCLVHRLLVRCFGFSSFKRLAWIVFFIGWVLV